jgi:hypothetical protein
MRPLIHAATAVLLALTLGSCSGDEPAPTTPTTAPTTAANPDATLPPMPEVAKEFSRPGLSQFVRHYVAVLGHAANTGDVTGLRKLSAAGCEGCARYIDYYVRLYGDGGFVRQSWTAPFTTVVRFQPRAEAESFVTTRVKISRGRHKASREKQAHVIAGSRDKVTFALRYSNGWAITQMWAGDYE